MRPGHAGRGRRAARPDVRPPQPEQDRDRGRLAGAVRPEQRKDLTPLELEVDAVERADGREGLADAFEQRRRTSAACARGRHRAARRDDASRCYDGCSRSPPVSETDMASWIERRGADEDVVGPVGRDRAHGAGR